MRRIHVFYIAILGIFLFFALLTGRREFFLCFFIVLALAPIALLLNLWTYWKLNFTQKLSAERVAKEGDASLNITVENNKPFGFKDMKLHVRLMPTQEDKELEVELKPNYSVSFNLALDCKYRGIYRVGISKLEVTDIFGFFHMTYDFDKRNHYALLRQRVYPRVLNLQSGKFIEDDMRVKVAISNEIAEFGDSFAALRNYRIGDPIKRIHWPAAARKNELFVKTYDAPIESVALIIVDTSVGGFEGENCLKYADMACESAIAIAKATSSMGYATHVTDISLSKYYTWKSKRQSLNILVEKLTELPFSSETRPIEVLRAIEKTEKNIDTVYFITHKQEPKFEQYLLGLLPGAARLSLICISDAEQKSAAPSTRVNCTNLIFGENIVSKLGGAL